MARSRFVYTLSQVAGMIGENRELIEEVTTNYAIQFIRQGRRKPTKRDRRSMRWNRD